MTRSKGRAGASVLGSHIDAVDWVPCLDRIFGWAGVRMSRYVCLCNVHSVVTARRDPDFARVIDGADLAVPDGAPLAWCLRRFGFPRQARIAGPDLMWKACARAAVYGTPVFLCGGTPETLERLATRLACEFPRLRVAGRLSPPFRRLGPAEHAEIVRTIERSGARIVFVGLGCPAQEQWMAACRGALPAVMIGVGAAFDFHAGAVRRAPPWMRDAGLEWLHRLLAEPQRLWRRYLVTNALFLAYLLRDAVAGGRRWRARI
jgi:N-acetylglucosaminyldiphosphoundecaprenol N-acetyl-beta-D-mannosaminyltransferase